MKIFCISQEKEIISSVSRYLKYVCGIDEEFLEEIVVPHKFEDPYRLFQYIYHKILPKNEIYYIKELREAIGIINLGWIGIEDLDPIIRLKETWASAIAMLVLAFPEIHWIFISLKNWFKENKSQENKLKELKPHLWDKEIKEWISLFFYTNYSALFDPFGLRNFIRKKINENPETKGLVLYARDYFAVSIDEEPASAYMHAYVAYRFGFKTLVITKQRLMNWALKNKNKDYCPHLSLEDLFLNFPDKSGKMFSDIGKRDNCFTKLKNIPYRFFITVGHSKGAKPLKENIQNLKDKRIKFNFIYKPISGIYPLKKELHLEEIELDGRKYVKEFIDYEKIKEKIINYSNQEGGHSSPGRLLIVAEYLTQRAEVLLNSAITVEDAIHGAVLALDAKELLSYRTPTTTMEALALQHQLEVLAECMFYGVEYHFDVKERVKELQKEIKIIGNWFNPSTRENSELNAILSILGHLINIFRNYSQFDEELECLHFLRKFHGKLLFKRNKFFIFIYPLVLYIEKLITSLRWFILALFFWPLFWGILFFLCEQFFSIKCWNLNQHSSLILDIYYSFLTFFGQPLEISASLTSKILCICETICGFLHLGIFISYIFNLIMRK